VAETGFDSKRTPLTTANMYNYRKLQHMQNHCKTRCY